MTTQNLIETYQADSILRGYIIFAKYADKVMRYVDARLREDTGFSFIKYMVLHSIAANGGTLTPSEIASRTFRRRNDMTTLVRRLVRDGLVVSERNDIDKRFVNITLTDKGRGMVPKLASVVRRIANQVMLSMAEADVCELEKFMELLGRNADDGLDI